MVSLRSVESTEQRADPLLTDTDAVMVYDLLQRRMSSHDTITSEQRVNRQRFARCRARCSIAVVVAIAGAIGREDFLKASGWTLALA